MRILLFLLLIAPICNACSQDKMTNTNEQILFFQSNNEGSKGDLFMMNSDGSNKRQIGRSGSRPDHYPNWSKQTNKITFESYRRGGWRIWIMDKDGGNARRLNNEGYGTQNYEFDPTFNADGTKVIYTTKGDLHEIQVGSGNTRRLTNTDGIWESHPTVSVNDMVAYVAGDESGSHIYTMSLSSNRPTPITSKKNIDIAPVWSPKGDEILFYSNREGGFELFLMNRDGSNVRRLISDETLKHYGIKRGKYRRLDEGWNAGLQYKASFSDNGQWIAFSADTNDSREIFLCSINGKTIKQLTRNKIHDGFPVFCPE